MNARIQSIQDLNVIFYMNNYVNINKMERLALAQGGVRVAERGMALIMGLMLLLVITILGIATMRGTMMQERMSASNQQQAITFQGAETAIRTVMDELRAVTPPPAGVTQSLLITALNNGTAPTSTQLATTLRTADTTSLDTASGVITNGTTSTATLTYANTTISAGSSMGIGSSGSVLNYNFVIDATSTQANTNAASRHQQGIARQGPGAS